LLTAWLAKLKSATSVLAKEANAVGRAFYYEHLSDEIEKTQQLFEKVSPGEELGIHEGQENSSRAIALRHMFLQIERETQSIPGNDEKLVQLTETLNEIVSDIQAADNDSPQRTDRVKQWTELCDAAISVIHDPSTRAEDELIMLLQQVNSDLGLGELVIPDRKRQTPDHYLIADDLPDDKHQRLNTQIEDTQFTTDQHFALDNNFNVDLHKLKDLTGRQKVAINNLLNQRNEAESDVTVKVNELQRLQRHLKESELCVAVLEDEINALQRQLAGLTLIIRENKSMQDTTKRFVSVPKP
jgi:hypothetical protein